jgi:hypothetical protein
VTIDVRHAKRQLSRIWNRLAARGAIVLGNKGRGIAHLVLRTPQESRRPGLVVGRLTEEFFEPLPEDELAAWQQ